MGPRRPPALGRERLAKTRTVGLVWPQFIDPAPACLVTFLAAMLLSTRAVHRSDIG